MRSILKSGGQIYPPTLVLIRLIKSVFFYQEDARGVPDLGENIENKPLFPVVYSIEDIKENSVLYDLKLIFDYPNYTSLLSIHT